jgi:hypothetical protein
MLSPIRDLVAVKPLLELALHRTGRVRPRLINIDGHSAYASAIAELKQSRGWEDGAAAGHRGTCPGAGSSFHQRGDCRQPLIPVGGRRAEYDRGIRIDAHDPKSQIQWLPKGDVVGQIRFIHQVCGIATDMLAVGLSRFSLEFLFATDPSDKVDFN